MLIGEPEVEPLSRVARRLGVSGRRRVTLGALALAVATALAVPSAVGAAEPRSAAARSDGSASQGDLPRFTCVIPHATTSTALGTFATSLTVWTHIADAGVEHAAAVLWLEPAIVGALDGIDVAVSSTVATGNPGTPTAP